MLEEYFLVQGREWERFAWLKSRIVAPADAAADPRALALRSLVTPFVYRRYLDYGVFEGLRQLHRRIREEAQRRAAGRPERANDVKLSRGGIREIEFIVQLMQVVRGGRLPEIRTRSTLEALRKLADRGLVQPQTAQRLAEAYVFLRRVEHRIQYLDDQQTHLLPTADGDLGWIAATLDMRCDAEACELIDQLLQVREFVATEFDALLHDGGADDRPGCRHCGKGPLPIGRVMGRLLARAGYAGEQAADGLAEAWRQACPEAFRGRSQPGLVRRGVLEVFLRHSALVQEFGFHKRDVLEQIQRLLPAAGIADIRCRVLPDAGSDAG
jgi:glutamate-ammonia-ligase adenylyltransferase